MPGRLRRFILLLTATSAAAVVAGTTAGAASAAPSWGCTSTPLTASLLGASLNLAPLTSNPSETPCVDDSASILDVDLATLVGLSADVLDSSTTTTNAVVPDRVVTADAEVTDLGLEAVGFANLLAVDVAQTTATARCLTTGPGATPTLDATSSFSGIRVLGQNIAVGATPVVLDVLGLVHVEITPNQRVQTATSLRQVALHVEISALLGGAQVLTADIASATVSATDAPCAASTAGIAPSVTVAPGPGDRGVTAQVTPASPAAHDAIQSCSIAARPQGSADPFVAVTTSFDAASGACSATLDPATFPGPATYEVRATATDGDGDAGTGTVAVSVPAAGGGNPGGGNPGGGNPGGGNPGGGNPGGGTPGGGSPGDGNAGAGGGSGSFTSTPSTVPSGVPAGGELFRSGSAVDLWLACGNRQLVLTDVRQQGKRVALVGVAAKHLRGKRVAIVFQATGRVVARPKVGRSGTFRARVAAPARRIAASNGARYVARVGSQRSLALKLQRRMPSVKVAVRGGKVTFAGVVTGPQAGTVQTVSLKRLVACGRYETVQTVKLGKRGAYRFSVAAPEGVRAAIYRADTRIASRAGGRATGRSYTLPTAVELH